MTSAPLFHAVTSDGWRLEIERAGPGSAGADLRAAVLAGHAMMANRRSLDRPPGRGLASSLAAGGRLAVYTFDCRGHGGSRAGGGGRSPTDWDYDDVALRDVPAAAAAVRARHPGLPLVVLGHSLVGHAALAWLGQEPDAPVDAVVALGANVWLPRFEPDRLVWAEKRILLELWRASSIPLGYFPARRLRLGTEDVPRRYVEQFHRWARDDAWIAGDGRDYLAGLGRVRVPVLAVVGAEDRLMCTPASGRAFARRLSSARVDFRVVGRPGIPELRASHMGLVTAPAAAPLWNDLERWIVDAASAR